VSSTTLGSRTHLKPQNLPRLMYLRNAYTVPHTPTRLSANKPMSPPSCICRKHTQIHESRIATRPTSKTKTEHPIKSYVDTYVALMAACIQVDRQYAVHLCTSHAFGKSGSCTPIIPGTAVAGKIRSVRTEAVRFGDYAVRYKRHGSVFLSLPSCRSAVSDC
jgi:hypothetical protein